MGSYLQQYGAEDERRSRTIKWIVLTCVGVVIIVIAAYLFFHNFPEKQVVKHFLARVNARDYQDAYRDWGLHLRASLPQLRLQPLHGGLGTFEENRFTVENRFRRRLPHFRDNQRAGGRIGAAVARRRARQS